MKIRVKKQDGIVKRELPHNYCAPGRHWVESQENHNGFASVDGEARHVTVWTCPLHRGEVTELPPSQTEAHKAELRRMDRAADRELKDQGLTLKWGPTKKVAARLGGGSKTTERVRLECGHEFAVTKGVDEARCRKCRVAPPKAEITKVEGDHPRGPMRAVRTRKPTGAATTERATLTCGHELAITKGADRARCSKCKKEARG